jgi:membrane-associated phospholipid phosphatase
VASAWFFAKLGSEVLEGELLTIDRVVQHWVVQHRPPFALWFFRIVTFLGAKELLAPVGAILAWRLFRGTKALVALLGFAALAAAEFVALIKRNFHITRPAGGVEAGLGYSFPSGHATGVAAMAILFAYVSVRKHIHPRTVVPACTIAVILVGVSRVYLDVHWASDVIGGWLVGAAFGVGCCAMYELMHRRQSRPSEEPS